MKRWPIFLSMFCLLLFVTVTVPLFASGEKGRKSEEPLTLTIWDWHSSEIPQVMGALYEEFEQKHNVNLVVQSLEWGELPKKLFVAAEADSMPDLIEIWAIATVPPLAEKGSLELLDPYIEKEGGKVFLDSYFEWILTPYKGKFYSLPVFAGNEALFYNKDLFAEAGITHPPRTWEELITYSKKLTKPEEGQYGFTLDGADPEALFLATPFIAQNGGRVGLPAELGRMPEEDIRIEDIGINNQEAVEALQFIKDMVTKYDVIPTYLSTSNRLARESFAKGKAAMHIDGPWGVAITQSFNPTFEWGIAVLPNGPKGHGGAVITGDTEFAMSSTCKDKELGWEFIKFMTGAKSNEFWITNAPSFPAQKSVAALPEVKNDPFLKPFVDDMEAGNVLASYNHMPPQLNAAIDKWLIEMQNAVLGKKTMQQAMDEVAIAWLGMWNEWKEKYSE